MGLVLNVWLNPGAMSGTCSKEGRQERKVFLCWRCCVGFCAELFWVHWKHIHMSSYGSKTPAWCVQLHLTWHRWACCGLFLVKACCMTGWYRHIEQCFQELVLIKRFGRVKLLNSGSWGASKAFPEEDLFTFAQGSLLCVELHCKYLLNTHVSSDSQLQSEAGESLLK